MLAVDTTVEVSLITTAGLIIVAIISVFTAKITSGARKEAKISSADAAKSAVVARDYAAALGAKDALIGALEGRVVFLENQNSSLLERIDDLERRVEESDEVRRSAALLERAQRDEIDDLRARIDRLRVDK